MNKFKGILICTDLDGTLLKNDKTISKENIEAIEYFKANGGFFTFVTGRMPSFASDMNKAIKPNAPVGCVNGAALYDYASPKYVWTAKMDERAEELISFIDKNFPDVGIQINTYYKTYFCKENGVMENFRKLVGVPNLVCDYRGFKEPLAKIVLGSESDETILSLEKALKNHPLANEFEFVRPERVLYDILPKNSNKGMALMKLAEHLKIDKRKTVAIGDYNNDIPMIKRAAVGIAVSNASEETQEAADFITVSNEENAIARVICDLERGKFGI